MVIGTQNGDVGRAHDFGGDDAVTIFALQRGQQNNVILPDIAQRTEQRVAMASDAHVAGLARERRSANVARRAAAWFRRYLRRRPSSCQGAEFPCAPAIRWSNRRRVRAEPPAATDGQTLGSPGAESSRYRQARTRNNPTGILRPPISRFGTTAKASFRGRPGGGR